MNYLTFGGPKGGHSLKGANTMADIGGTVARVRTPTNQVPKGLHVALRIISRWAKPSSTARLPSAAAAASSNNAHISTGASYQASAAPITIAQRTARGHARGQEGHSRRRTQNEVLW